MGESKIGGNSVTSEGFLVEFQILLRNEELSERLVL